MIHYSYTNNRKFFYFFIVFVCTYLIYLGYLSVYLLVPYGDEVFFADIVHNFFVEKRIVGTANALLNLHWEQTQQESLGYGNMYFLLSSYFCAIFGGFTMENYRMAGVFTAILSVVLSYFCVSFQKFLKPAYLYFFVACYLFDFAFVQGIMQFRMDQMALCFVLLATICCLCNNRQKIVAPPLFYTSFYPLFYAFFSGIFAALALLTTPRVAILLVGIGLVYVRRTWQNKAKTIDFVLFLVGVILVYGTWIWVKFGGIGNFIDYYLHQKLVLVYMKQESNWIRTLVLLNTDFSINIFQYPSFLAVIIAIAVQIKTFKKKFIDDELMFMSLCNLILYYLLIHKQVYSFYILPFTLLIILKTLQNIETMKNRKYIFYSLLSYTICIFCSIFVYRAIKLQIFAGDKNYTELYKQIRNKIPKNSNVIGSEIFYYAITCNQSNFQYLGIVIPPIKDQSIIDLPRTIQKMIDIHKTSFKPQYLIIETENTQRNRDKMLQEAYFKAFHLVPYHQISISTESTGFAKFAKSMYKRFGLATPPNYNAMIYKVVE